MRFSKGCRASVVLFLASFAPAADKMPSGVQVTKTASGAEILADAKGMTLYTFDKDSVGKSACNGKCAQNWPPLLVEDGASSIGEWNIVTRDDGSKQWAYKGKPLYTWVKDRKAGDTTGNGVGQVWHTAVP